MRLGRPPGIGQSLRPTALRDGLARTILTRAQLTDAVCDPYAVGSWSRVSRWALVRLHNAWGAGTEL